MWLHLTPFTMLIYVVLAAAVGFLGRRLRGGFAAFFILSLIFTPALIVVLMAICRPVFKPARRTVRRTSQPIPPRMPRGWKTKPHHGGHTMVVEKPPVPVVSAVTRLEARHVIEKQAFLSAAGGLFPVPGVDIVLITSSNIFMVRDLAAIYGVPYHVDRAKALIASILAGALPVALAGAFGFSRYLRFIPVIGQTIVPFGTSVFAAATTYALGGVFQQHFENGGTLLNLRPDDVREYFHHEFEKAKETVTGEPATA